MAIVRKALPVALAAVVCGLCLDVAAQEAIVDPVPEAIAKGALAVAAVPFVRAPRTEDPTRHWATNDAYARIQYLQPVPGSPRLAFNDIRGILYLTDANGAEPNVYLDLRERDVAFHNGAFPNEAGFMGFAFHPQFATPNSPGYGKFYTAFDATAESGVADYAESEDNVQESVVREWTANDPEAAAFAGTTREVMRVGQFAPNHNAGTVAFSPNAKEGDDDFGLLYICFGDGGGGGDPQDNGQNLANPLGAIARIDPLATSDDSAYGIPPSNPFAGDPDAAGEIWAYGLRHAQQFSWDVDGRMFIGDIGQNQVEEVNLGVAGANYGWRLREGTFATGHEYGTLLNKVYPLPEVDADAYVYPVAQYDHDEGFAVGGGYVYRGSGIPALHGWYVFTEFPRGRVLAIHADDLRPGEPAEIVEVRVFFDGVERDLVDVAGFPNPYNRAFPRVDARLGIDHRGELYLLTKGDGWIRRLVAHRTAPAPSAATTYWLHKKRQRVVCEDGSVVIPGEDCTKECEDGQRVPQDDDCPSESATNTAR